MLLKNIKMPATSSNNKNDIKIVINSDKPKPKRKYKKKSSTKKRPVDTPLTNSYTSANPAPAFNYGGMVNKQPYDTQSSAIQREVIARENRAYIEEMRNRNLRGGSLNHTDRLAESLVNDNFLDPLEQRVPPILSPLQKSILRHNSHHNEFETLSAPAGHWENPNDASSVSDLFHTPIRNSGSVQNDDEDEGFFSMLKEAKQQQRQATEEDASPLPRDISHVPTPVQPAAEYNPSIYHKVVQTDEHYNPKSGRPRSSTIDSSGAYNQLVYAPRVESREIDATPRDINYVPLSGGGFDIRSTDSKFKED